MAAVFASAAMIGSFVALVWVYQWAIGNNNVADEEIKRLIVSVLIACVLLAMPMAISRLADPVGQHGLTALLAAGATGAFVAVAASGAATLLIAMAISPATDPGDFGRPLFRVAYVGALLLSLCAGLCATWSARGRDGGHMDGVWAALLTLVLTIVAWGYLAVGSSELNKCIVDDEFPLATDFGECSGY
ncbi:MAG TPA: hypothetical protein VJP07_02060 [Dehalococcoidia bacterium]|nr:hypothetical protein [Dehalococcoidia bacterium]